MEYVLESGGSGRDAGALWAGGRNEYSMWQSLKDEPVTGAGPCSCLNDCCIPCCCLLCCGRLVGNQRTEDQHASLQTYLLQHTGKCVACLSPIALFSYFQDWGGHRAAVDRRRSARAAGAAYPVCNKLAFSTHEWVSTLLLEPQLRGWPAS